MSDLAWAIFTLIWVPGVFYLGYLEHESQDLVKRLDRMIARLKETSGGGLGG